ncbi:MAG: ATP-grasp domain-containing protein [Candidatus Magasanikbacteria bacterium]|nr:ATP-grasp domain-containing protein [Candidatus Magasanikbacteria bacterium]
MSHPAIKNILITCAGGSGPLYLAKQLKKKGYHVYLSDGSNESIARFLGFPFALMPFGNSQQYLPAVKDLIRRWNIQCIVPGADEELLAVAKLCEEIPHLQAVLPRKDFIAACLNKKELMKRLAKLSISSLLSFATRRSVAYPAAVKPMYGRGSRGFHIVHNSRQLAGYLALYNKKFSELVVQPYIAGDEYTVSVIVNNKNQLLAIVCKKILLKRGITKAAVVVKNNVIDRVCRMIVKKMSPGGPFNVQLKLYKGKVYIFEINPRLSTTSVLTDQACGNEVELYIHSFNRAVIKKQLPVQSGIFLYRYEENFFKFSRTKLKRV